MVDLMKFVSFNINGLRARPHQLQALVEQHQPDVIGLQETKVHDEMFPLEEVDEPKAQEKILDILRAAAAIYNKEKVPA